MYLVHCIDRLPEPDEEFLRVQKQTDQFLGGELHYHGVDVRDEAVLSKTIEDIASRRQRLDGLLAAAGIQHIEPAIEYGTDDISEMLSINYTAVFKCAQLVARQMIKYRSPGSIVLVASISGMVSKKQKSLLSHPLQE